jgi:histone-lysine N-methyltransferase SETMAR
VPQLSQLTDLPSTAVYRRLAQPLGFVARHLRWVSHALSDARKGERVNLSRRLLRMLEVQRDQAWHDIVTLDESWFYLSTDYEFVWLPREEKFPKENDTQSNRKFMVTIVWNPRGFHLIKVLEKGRKFNASCYIVKILESLSQWRSIEAAGNEQKLLVHADNARPHTAKLSTQYFNENRMKSVPHPPCSPDLAPWYCYLFGYVKRCLAGPSFEETDQLFAVVEGILEDSEK